jgi:hypothetical protein
LRSAARHVGAVTQKRRPAPGPSERRDGHRKPSDRILLAFGDLLSSVADAAGVVPERSSVLKNFPACSSEKVAPSATVCQLVDTKNDNASSLVSIPDPAVGRGPGRSPAGHYDHDNGAGVPDIPGRRGSWGTGRAAGRWTGRWAGSARWRPAGRQAGGARA